MKKWRDAHSAVDKRALLREAKEVTGGNVTQMAKLVGISREAMSRILHEHTTLTLHDAARDSGVTPTAGHHAIDVTGAVTGHHTRDGSSHPKGSSHPTDTVMDRGGKGANKGRAGVMDTGRTPLRSGTKVPRFPPVATTSPEPPAVTPDPPATPEPLRREVRPRLHVDLIEWCRRRAIEIAGEGRVGSLADVIEEALRFRIAAMEPERGPKGGGGDDTP